jgi:hypothetical protein
MVSLQFPDHCAVEKECLCFWCLFDLMRRIEIHFSVRMSCFVCCSKLRELSRCRTVLSEPPRYLKGHVGLKVFRSQSILQVLCCSSCGAVPTWMAPALMSFACSHGYDRPSACTMMMEHSAFIWAVLIAPYSFCGEHECLYSVGG